MFQPWHHPADTMQTWRNFLQIISIALSCFFSTSPSKKLQCLEHRAMHYIGVATAASHKTSAQC